MIALNTESRNHKIQLFARLLPLLTAVLLQTHIRFLTLKLNSALEYFEVFIYLVIQSLPFFVALTQIKNSKAHKQGLILFTGFCIFPLILLVIENNSTLFLNDYFIDFQGWLLCVLASICTLLIDRKNSFSTRYTTWLKKLLDIDIMVFIVFTGWGLIMACVFASHSDPMLNQPFNLIIDFSKLAANFSIFLYYLWQFLAIAWLLYSLYWCLRYLLIRTVLTQFGIMVFISACLLLILTATPLITYLTLLLPINDLPASISNLTPAGERFLFHPDNYQFCFIFLLLSTPIILIFEHTQHQVQLNQIAKQHAHTELKLLQQQVNPHFLFNTLNNLYALTLTKSDSAPDLVIQLSSLLRYSVYEGAKPWVKLRYEITYMESFIALQQIRSGDKCKFITQWPDNAEHFKIPPLLLITLLENAIKHGVEPAMSKVTVEFIMQMSHNTLTVMCKNAIINPSPAKQGGFGLMNLQKRLTLLFAHSHHLVHSQANEQWTTTLTMELPRC